MDRPTKDLFALLDEIEEVLGITAVPVVWPIGTGPDFKGVYNREEKKVNLFQKTQYIKYELFHTLHTKLIVK